MPKQDMNISPNQVISLFLISKCDVESSQTSIAHILHKCFKSTNFLEFIFVSFYFIKLNLLKRTFKLQFTH